MCQQISKFSNQLKTVTSFQIQELIALIDLLFPLITKKLSIDFLAINEEILDCLERFRMQTAELNYFT